VRKLNIHTGCRRDVKNEDRKFSGYQAGEGRGEKKKGNWRKNTQKEVLLKRDQPTRGLKNQKTSLTGPSGNGNPGGKIGLKKWESELLLTARVIAQGPKKAWPE